MSESASPSPTGRPTKCTPAFIEKTRKLLEAGCYPETAVAMLGVSWDSYKRWMKQGASDVDAGVASPFAKLHSNVEAGQARAEAKAMGNLITAAGQDWRAAESYLKLRNKDRYGTQKQIIETSLSAEDLTQLTEALSGLVGLFVEEGRQQEAMTWVATELDKIGKM